VYEETGIGGRKEAQSDTEFFLRERGSEGGVFGEKKKQRKGNYPIESGDPRRENGGGNLTPDSRKEGQI